VEVEVEERLYLGGGAGGIHNRYCCDGKCVMCVQTNDAKPKHRRRVAGLDHKSIGQNVWDVGG